MRIGRLLKRGPSKAFLASLCFCLAIALATVVLSPPCGPQCPKVDTEKRTGDRVEAQTGGQQAVAPERGSQPENTQGREQATERESTVPFLWWRIKASELLLIFFAFALRVATRNLVLGAENTSEVQLRAYMGIDRGAATIQGTDVVLWVDIKNRGQTPAYKVTRRFDAALLPTTTTKFELPKGDGRNWVIVPGAWWNARARLPFEQAESADWSFGAETIFLWGRIDYEDVFGDAHWMTFRYSMGDAVRDPTTGAIVAWEWTPTDDGNDASR